MIDQSLEKEYTLPNYLQDEKIPSDIAYNIAGNRQKFLILLIIALSEREPNNYKFEKVK